MGNVTAATAAKPYGFPRPEPLPMYLMLREGRVLDYLDRMKTHQAAMPNTQPQKDENSLAIKADVVSPYSSVSEADLSAV